MTDIVLVALIGLLSTLGAVFITQLFNAKESTRRAQIAERQEREGWLRDKANDQRSEEHTSELQSLMRISYAVFCLKTKKKNTKKKITHTSNNKQNNGDRQETHINKY